jgi:RNA polymerase sigma-70 factor (ECF subfamily)
VVLDTLAPAERIAFVLHDLFDLTFDEIAAVVGRSPTAARQLASRARRRVQGAATVPAADFTRKRAVVDAFLAALRGGDFDALVAVLDPDVVVRADGPPGAPREVRGARTWAKGALAFSRFAHFARPAIVNGTVGVVMAPRGRLFRALHFTITRGKIVQIDVVADPVRLRQLRLAVLA